MKHFGFFIKLCLSIGILIALGMRLNTDVMNNLYQGFKPGAWFAATFLIALQSFLLAWRWKILIDIGKNFLSLRKSVSINFISQLANMVFITSIGGLVARIAMTVPCGVSLQKCIVASIVDRFMTLCALIIVAALLFPVYASHMPGEIARETAPYFGAVAIILLLLAPPIAGWVYKRLKPITTTPRLRALRRYGGTFFGRPKIYAKTIFVSLCAQASFFTAVIILTKAAGVDADVLSLLSMLPVIALVASLPISIGGWGVREGAFVYGYALLNIPMETAFIVSVEVGLIGMMVSVLLGIPSLMRSRFPFLSRKSSPQSVGA